MIFYLRYFNIFFIIFIVAVFVSSCGIRKGPEPNASVENVVAQDSKAKQDIRSINEKLFASVKSAPSAKDYVLAEGDLLQVSVFEAQELKTECRIGARGFISLPLLGIVEIKGLTACEAEQKIEELYRNRRFLKSPHVNIFVKEQVSGKITLMGALKKPGTFPYLSRQNLFETLALAEGLSDTAGKVVQVRRPNLDSDRPFTFIVDLNELAPGTGDELNIEIKGGDVIYVPEAGMVYVDGAVRKPGNYPIKRKMNVVEAIVSAGGFAPYAEQDTIKLVRSRGDKEPDVVKLNFKDLEKQDSSHSIQVQDRDIIFVETNKIEAVIYGLQITGLGGVVGVGYRPPVPQ